MRAEGLQGTTAPLVSREQPVEQVRAERPDVVLLDLDPGEPIGDGTDLVEPFTRPAAGCWW